VSDAIATFGCVKLGTVDDLGKVNLLNPPVNLLTNDPQFKALMDRADDMRKTMDAFTDALYEAYRPILEALGSPDLHTRIEQVMREIELIERRRRGPAWARHPEPARFRRFAR